jgi:uncharacterized protein YecE (DUF72 family)
MGGKEYNYRYKYTGSDLRRLAELVEKYLMEGRRVYVLFNNVYMADDAIRFIEALSGLGLPAVWA